MNPEILVVIGSQRPEPRLRVLCDVAAQSAASSGARVTQLDLSTLNLPVMRYGDEAQASDPGVVRVREAAAAAHGFILATPEYHGSMSGALKNWFDFLYEELAGKVAGVLATTGGGSGDMSISAVKTSFMWCHGFVIPFHAAASDRTFTDAASLDERIRQRVERIGHDVARYTAVLRPAFEHARARASEGTAAGFAGVHAG